MCTKLHTQPHNQVQKKGMGGFFFTIPQRYADDDVGHAAVAKFMARDRALGGCWDTISRDAANEREGKVVKLFSFCSSSSATHGGG